MSRFHMICRSMSLVAEVIRVPWLRQTRSHPPLEGEGRRAARAGVG